MTIKDYKCTPDPGIAPNLIKNLDADITFPEAYLERKSMAKLSKAIKEASGSEFCVLPFCHTLEGEALGGIVNYGNETTGPRAKEFICKSPEEVLLLTDIDFSKGRIRETLEAAEILTSKGEEVLLEISGPFTILNVLMDFSRVARTLRKNRPLMKEIYWKLGNQVLAFVEEAVKKGVTLFSYADSSGGVNILGPKFMEQVVEDFTFDFVKKLRSLLSGKGTLILCPKTTFALLGAEKAELINRPVPPGMTYGKACVISRGEIGILGQRCIKDRGFILKNGLLKEVVLK